MTLKECYAILGLARTARIDDVKRAYRRRAFELHPDLNPNLVDASRQFQLLNEAYVNLMRVLSAQEDKSAETKPGTERDKRQEARRKAGPEQAAPGPETAGPQAQPEAETDRAETADEGAERPDADKPDDKKRKAADEAYARQEEVLRDILNDQFARRVFEDIYSAVNRRQKPEADAEQPAAINPRTPPKPRRFNLEWGNKAFNLDLTNGVTGAMRSWLRRQIDDELTVRLPRAKLFPGARVRLQIRQGLAKESRVVDVTLPPDFKTGKAIRLKGMGKKVGKWIGDLYLIIEAQT